MDKLEELRAGVADMRMVAQKLSKWANDLEEYFQKTETPPAEAAAETAPAEKKKASAGRKKPEPAAAPVQENPEPAPLSYEDAREILSDRCAAGYSAQVKSLIESYGVNSLKKVPPEHYRALVDAVSRLGGVPDAG